MTNFTCNSCGESKNKLVLRKSSVMPGIELMMCKSCIDAKFEPRYTIILAGRTYGADSVKWHINRRKYFGESILFEEIHT